MGLHFVVRIFVLSFQMVLQLIIYNISHSNCLIIIKTGKKIQLNGKYRSSNISDLVLQLVVAVFVLSTETPVLMAKCVLIKTYQVLQHTYWLQSK